MVEGMKRRSKKKCGNDVMCWEYNIYAVANENTKRQLKESECGKCENEWMIKSEREKREKNIDQQQQPMKCTSTSEKYFCVQWTHTATTSTTKITHNTETHSHAGDIMRSQNGVDGGKNLC